MKKRIFAILLCAVLLLALLPGAEAAGAALSLISVDDLLPAELINALVYYGGTAYVPAWLFSSYGLGISYSYNNNGTTATASFSSGERKISFEPSTGRTYDGDDYQYSVPAIVRGGTVYVPLSFMCGFFGTFSYTNIGGSEYGSILRIHTGRELLTDEEFLRLAKPAMQRYYEAYYPETGPEEPVETPQPSSAPAEPPHEGERILLGLSGLPGEAVTELLDRIGMSACFFLTAEEIRSDPDTVRRLACEGFGLGAACPEGTVAEFDEAAELLWEAARVPASLVLLPEGAAVPKGTAAFRFDFAQTADGDRMAPAYAVTSALENGGGDRVLVFPCSGENETAFSVLAYYLRDQGFTVTALREIDATN